MPRTHPIQEDEEREDRILFDVVVDAYSESERALGWYYYLQEQLLVPFPARCTKTAESSTLRTGEKVTVLELASHEECEHEIKVKIEPIRGISLIQLEQLTCLAEDFETCEAVCDWHYWVARGYTF